jgi:hypothetical protein
MDSWLPLTLRPPTNRPSNIMMTHAMSTEHSNHCDVTTVTFWLSDMLLLWHFALFSVLPGNYSSIRPLKVGCFVTVLGLPPFFYLDCDKTSTFPLPWFVDVLSHVTGPLLGVFWLDSRGWQNVTIVTFYASPTMDCIGLLSLTCPNPIWPPGTWQNIHC